MIVAAYRALSVLLWTVALALMIFGGLLTVAYIVINFDMLSGVITLAATVVGGVGLVRGALWLWDRSYD